MKNAIFIFCCLCSIFTRAQHRLTIAEWNFNSSPPDHSAISGTLNPAKGSGKLTQIGGLTPTFASASTDGGSSDEDDDNSALNLSKWPSQSQRSDSCGIEFQLSAYGYRHLKINFDLRLSASASRFYHLYYSIDSGTTWRHPVLIEFTQSGSSWMNLIAADLSQLDSLTDQTGLHFKLVSCFEPGTSRYKAVGSSYSSAGTFRIDMLKITGEPSSNFKDTEPPTVKLVECEDPNTIHIAFSEAMDKVSTLKTASYSGLLGDFSVIPDYSDSGLWNVYLSFPHQFKQGTHQLLRMDSLRDKAGNLLVDTGWDVFLNGTYPKLVFSEIMYNDLEDDLLEYVELYNNSSDTIPLEGFYFEGIDYRFGQERMLPRDYLLIAIDSTEAKRVFKKDFIQWKSGTLKNTGECLALLNQPGFPVTKVCYKSTGSWPRNANGKGSSLELRSPDTNDSLPSSWRDGFATSAFLPGKKTYHGSPGFGFGQTPVKFNDSIIHLGEGISKVKVKITSKSGVVAPWVKLRLRHLRDSLTTEITLIDSVIKLNLHEQFCSLLITDDEIRNPKDTLLLEFEELLGAYCDQSFVQLIITDNDLKLAPLCISEWMPQNTNKVKDDKGEYEPWFEIHNPNNYPVNLESYLVRVSDLNSDSTWTMGLPNFSIAAGSFQIFYADSQPQQGPRHLSLPLPRKNGSIELLSNDTITIQTRIEYGFTYSNKSQGLAQNCSGLTTNYDVPTPGGPNGFTGMDEEDPDFSSKLWPNPNLGSILNLPYRGDFQIFSAEGKLLFEVIDQQYIYVDNLPSGLYYLRTRTGTYARFNRL